MTSNVDLAYPADYYYPEFIESRPDDPLQPPSTNLPLTSAVENGIGSSTKMPPKTTTSTTTKKPVNKNQPPSLALDVMTDQGLPDTDITQSVKTDPKKSLVRDPAERNIPRLIVDDSVIKKTVRTPKIVTTNLDNDFAQTAYAMPTTYETKPLTNGHVNGDLRKKTKTPAPTKQQPTKYVEDEPPVDDYWKKEVFINDEGEVTIEPLKYDRNTYEGPFGLTRKGSFIFYIGLGIFTLLAGVFLIMTAIFYTQTYPSATSTTGTLTGLGVCALAFYLGLQLILIGLWHQKYRQENPKKIVAKSSKHNDSSANLKTSMEENEAYGYPYQQPMDYAPYADYSAAPYVSNVNEQMLFQQPDAATGAGSYEPEVWPSNVQVEAPIDPKFLQPTDWSYPPPPPVMEAPIDPKFLQSTDWSYQPPPVVESPSTVLGFTSAPNASNNTTKVDEKPEKKRHHRRHHHHSKKKEEAEPPKPKSDSAQPTSTVIEAPLPVLSKAPETNELLRSIAESEKTAQQTARSKSSKHDKALDDGIEVSSLNGHHRHSHRRHHHRRHRHHSRSPYSSSSDRSRHDFHSDAGHGHGHSHGHGHDHHDHHHHDHHRHLHRYHSEPREKIITPRPVKARTPSPPRPPRRNPNVYRETGTGTGLETKIMKDSGVTADLEDVPNVRDNRLEQIPVVRRTIIVEPYPAEPTSQIVVKPQSNMIGKVRLSKNEGTNGEGETFVYPSTTYLSKNSKKKNKTTGSNPHQLEDLRLEDVNDDGDDGDDHSKSRKKTTNRTTRKTNLKNAFYN